MLNVLFTVLAIAFILAKVFAIAPVAYWSWMLVLAPIWAPIAVGVLFVVLFATIHVLVSR